MTLPTVFVDGIVFDLFRAAVNRKKKLYLKRVVTLKVKHGFTRYSFFNELTHGYVYSNVDSLRLTRFKVHEQLSSLCVYIINAQLSQFPANSCQPLIRINKMKTT